MSTIDEVKARIDIVDLVSESVQLRRSGKNYTGFCPFHPNTRTPAFVVFPESGAWRCFGQCNEGGDIFSFVMKKEGWDFAEALRYLADRAGVELHPPTPEEQAAAEEHDELRALLEQAVTFYRHQLVNAPAGEPALDYLRQKRGLSAQTIEAFGLGYAPHSWDAMLNYFRSRGVAEADLLAAGLVSERESGGYYDRFRNRVMFPIRDARGRMAGFGARILDPDDVPKFLNSPQTAIFDKGGLLYGLDLARKAIRAQDQAVIVEGYLDVIALHQAGFANVVSPMGTALSEQQLLLLKRYSRRIVLALDPDAAGDKATMRGLQVARQALDHEDEPVFDARGLLRHEARLRADIRVSALPDGLDPDEVVNRDPGEWAHIVEQARPIVVHVMETLASGRDLDDPKIKDEIAAQVLPLIEDVPSPIERDTYRQRLARLLRVDERALLGAAPAARPGPRRTSRARPAPPATQAAAPLGAVQTAASNYALEVHCLGILLRRPDLLYQVDRSLRQRELAPLSPGDFQHADHQAILRLFQQSIDQDIAEPLNYVFNYLDLPMMELADGLLARTTKIDLSDERVLEDLMRGLLDLRLRNWRQEMEYLHYVMAEAQEQGDVKAAQYGQTMIQLSRVKLRLDQALEEYTGRSTIVRRA
ncbi:MAG: DNA primase [Anaerolineales bacterium]|nr:DNA primase [Anaerolineales bacterium]